VRVPKRRPALPFCSSSSLTEVRRSEEPKRGTGMYLVAWLNPGVDDQAAARAAASHGVDVIPLSTFCIRPLRRQGLVLGYSGYEVDSIRLAVKQLCAALAKIHT
jgi:GntR family transcriptional regulator/MocR family aminotransferase